MAEPEAKRQKTEGAEEEAPGPPPELETDAKGSTPKPLRSDAGFDLQDCTLNCIPSLGGRVLMPLTDGGMQYLIAGAKANLGVKRGRYLYEVKIVESLNPGEGPQGGYRRGLARNLLKVGFSTEASPLLLGDTDDAVFFDSEGFFNAEQKREFVAQRFSRDQTVAVLLNLDSASPNKNTVSLFRDGARMCQPQKLPEALVGKTLFPHVCFKNMTLHVNLGPPLTPLPFKCLGISEAGAVDAVAAPKPQDQCEVLFPVAVPDEGTFDWLDDFLAKNPKFVELSDRAIVKWAEKSGIQHNEAQSWKNCNDKPDPQFRLPYLDDFSARRVIQAVAPVQPRNYVVMEVKSNLIKEEREQLVKRFADGCFKTVAQVVMGEPPADLKQQVHSILLAEKQEKVTAEWKRRKAEKEQERIARKRQRELEEAKRRAEEEAKKRLEEIERANAEAAAAAAKAEAEAAAAEEAARRAAEAGATEVEVPKEASDVKMEETEVKKEEVKDDPMGVKEEVKTEVKEEVKEEPKAEEEPEEPEEPCPVAELTEEEKATWFKKKSVSDITAWTFGGFFTKFSLPEKDEGFGEIRYGWAQEAAAKEYFAQYIRKSKITTKIEDLAPGDWFKTKYNEWQNLLEIWKAKQREFQMRPPPPPPQDPPAEIPVPSEPAPEAAETTPAPPATEGDAPAATEAAAPAAEAAPAAPEAPKEEVPKAEEKKSAPGEVDVMSVEDVCNVRNETPLFALFAFEDWILLNLRAELSLLALAFAQDAADPERVGIHDSNLAFYFQKYFKKPFVPKQYGFNTNTEMIEKLVSDTVEVTSDTQVLSSKRSQEELGDFSVLVKLTEVARRERQAKLEQGDESAVLRLDVQAHMPPPPPHQMASYYGGQMGGYKGYGGDYKGDKGGYKGDKGGFKGYKGGGFDRGFKGGCGYKGDGGFGKDGKKGGFDKGKKGGDKGFGKKGKDGKPGKGY